MIEKCRCIRCDGPLRVDRISQGLEIEEGAIACTRCGATYDHVWGVPILCNYEQADFAALVEAAANAGLTSPFTPAGLDEWMNILPAYHAAADRDAYLNAQPSHISDYLPVRYSNWVELHRLTEGEDLHGREVLDVGAGLGFDSYALFKSGAHVTALEFSPILVREGARALPMLDWVGGMSHILPFADASFDYVFSNAALHHMRDVPASIEEMLRVLRPGGKLITTGDPYRADDQDEVAEMAIFNRHPDVLLGINEGVPRLAELVAALTRHRTSIAPRLYTLMMYNAWRLAASKTLAEFREWNFDKDLKHMRATSGSVAMKVALEKPIGAKARRQNTERTLRPATLSRWLNNQSEAMAHLSAWAPAEVVDNPFPGAKPIKFELLNGWQAPEGKTWRTAYRRARWYLRRRAEETDLYFSLAAAAGGAFDVLVNGQQILSIDAAPGEWREACVDLGSAPVGQPFAVEIRMRAEPPSFDEGLFRVAARRFTLEAPVISESSGMLGWLKRGLKGGQGAHGA